MVALHHVSSLPKQFWQKHGDIQGNRSNMLIKLNEQLCCSKLNDHNDTSDWVLIHVKTKTSPSFAQSKPWNFLFRIIKIQLYITSTTLYHIHHITNCMHNLLRVANFVALKKQLQNHVFYAYFIFLAKEVQVD